MAKKKQLPWQQEFDWAVAICALHGCKVERSTAMHEIAKVTGDGVSLVIYPHKSNANNYHARVRDQSSKDKAAADRVMLGLFHGEGLPEDEQRQVSLSCTFSQKNNSRHFTSLPSGKAIP